MTPNVLIYEKSEVKCLVGQVKFSSFICHDYNKLLIKKPGNLLLVS